MGRIMKAERTEGSSAAVGVLIEELREKNETGWYQGFLTSLQNAGEMYFFTQEIHCNFIKPSSERLRAYCFVCPFNKLLWLIYCYVDSSILVL